MLGHRPREGHPERPARLSAVTDALSEASDLELEVREAPLVEPDDLALAHDPKYVAALMAQSPTHGVLRLDEDTEMSPGSMRAARRAAGAVTAAVRSVASGEIERAFCAVRPPGHHAGRGFPMGFCLFSNVAVAAKAAQAAGLRRVAVGAFYGPPPQSHHEIFSSNSNQFFPFLPQYTCPSAACRP